MEISLDCQGRQDINLFHRLMLCLNFSDLCFCRFHVSCFGWPLTLGISTVPKMEKEHQEYAAVTHNDVHKDWKLVLAILHEKELADVDGDKNELDLTDGRMEYC